MKFDEEKQVKDLLLDKLTGLKDFDSGTKSEVLNQLIGIFAHYDLSSGAGKGYISYMVPRIYWVIRDEDLPIIESFITGFATAAGVGFFSQGSADQSKLMAAAAGLIATCYKLYRAISGKGKFLSQMDYKILLCLKNNEGGLDAHRLLNMLNLTKDTITLMDLDERLKTLQTIHTVDGSKRELIFIENQLYKVRGI